MTSWPLCAYHHTGLGKFCHIQQSYSESLLLQLCSTPTLPYVYTPVHPDILYKLDALRHIRCCSIPPAGSVAPAAGRWGRAARKKFAPLCNAKLRRSSTRRAEKRFVPALPCGQPSLVMEIMKKKKSNLTLRRDHASHGRSWSSLHQAETTRGSQFSHQGRRTALDAEPPHELTKIQGYATSTTAAAYGTVHFLKPKSRVHWYTQMSKSRGS